MCVLLSNSQVTEWRGSGVVSKRMWLGRLLRQPVRSHLPDHFHRGQEEQEHPARQQQRGEKDEFGWRFHRGVPALVDDEDDSTAWNSIRFLCAPRLRSAAADGNSPSGPQAPSRTGLARATDPPALARSDDSGSATGCHGATQSGSPKPCFNAMCRRARSPNGLLLK